MNATAEATIMAMSLGIICTCSVLRDLFRFMRANSGRHRLPRSVPRRQIGVRAINLDRDLDVRPLFSAELDEA